MKREKLMPILKWALYSVLLLLFYVLQTTPGLFQIFGAKPVLILALAVCVSMYEGVMASAMFSMAAGLLWDISSDKLFGFNGLIFLCCGLMISLLCIYYLRTKLWNSLLFCGVTLVVQGLLDYVFYYAIWNLENTHLILLRVILSNAAYTLAVTPLVFLLVRLIENRFTQTPRA